MLDLDYFVSLTDELRALKNRVRKFINNRHWQTDGEWKESVLRSFLRRNLPKSVEVGRGFVITDRGPSKQLDVLIYDTSKPVLFRDGDLVFITPDAAVGIIEVKTSLNNVKFRSEVTKLCKSIELIQSSSARRRIIGLFSFEDETDETASILQTLQVVTQERSSRIVHCICLGDSKFIKYWNLNPDNERQLLDSWYAYHLERMAPGYFIHNMIQAISPESVDSNKSLWFPAEGKSVSRIGTISLRGG